MDGRLAAALVAVLAVGALLWAFGGGPDTPDSTTAQRIQIAPESARTVQATPEPPPADVAPSQQGPSANSPATPEAASIAADFYARMAQAEEGDLDAAYEVGMVVLLCLTENSPVREAGEEGLPLPALDLSQYDCDDIPPEKQLAGRLLRQAADEGHVDAAREYGLNATYFVELESEELRDLSQSDMVAYAASEYLGLDYLEFAATGGDLPAATHLAKRLANGFTVPVRQSRDGIQLRASEPAQALSWFFAVQIANDEPWMASWLDDLRGQLDPQAQAEAEAQGQDYYYQYLANPQP